MKKLLPFFVILGFCFSCTKNASPTIDGLFADQDSVYPGDTVYFTCGASDVDGDPITFKWLYQDSNIGGPRWVAPKKPGQHYIIVTVTDGTNHAIDSIGVIVRDTTGTFTDARDGHQYKWIKIGGQIWMAENLAYLPALTPGSIWSITIPYYYVYGSEGSSISTVIGNASFKTYGALYNRSAALTACPSGWHLPTDSDWMILEKNKGMSDAVLETIGYRYSGNVGTLLKESGTAHWKSPNESANNSTGFTALPGGGFWDNGGYLGLGGSANFWSSSQDYWVTAWYRGLGDFHDGVHRDYQDRAFGLSVRCVKD
ncbi:MAG: hypothetical protein A2X22_07860 [Bacteroidetes bacterium GWF2_49_14]|nr:MAG: hypothetical protein A2X22_07860 [Bacteroidetes bacterium GWF2_49_14]